MYGSVNNQAGFKCITIAECIESKMWSSCCSCKHTRASNVTDGVSRKVIESIEGPTWCVCWDVCE